MAKATVMTPNVFTSAGKFFKGDVVELSDKEIKDYVVQRYGKDSLYEPDFSENLFLWLSPAVFLILIAVSVLLIRRR